MTPSVYIDGQAGTTGLRIHELLASRSDLRLLEIDPDHRKDPDARREQIVRSDLTILCLPDAAAREAVEWARDADTRILDASTAHRVDPSWVYGLAELSAGHGDTIAAAPRVSNPGCYPTGVILLLRPLILAGAVAADVPITVHALSGYSGGGRALITRWQDPRLGLSALPYEAPYALCTAHKHLPEMREYSGLRHAPHFVPAVGPFECGMRIEISLHAASLGSPAVGPSQAARMFELLHERYCAEPDVEVRDLSGVTIDEHTLDPRRCNGTNRVELLVVPHPHGHVLLVALLDNLGKGSGTAAVQNVELMLGLTSS